MPKVSDEMLRAVKTIGGSLTGPVAADMARELELARKVIAAARDHERWCSIKLSCRLCADLREYDAGETSEAQPEPRKPSFAAAADAIICREYAPRAVGVTWSGILDVIERARRASGE